MVILNHKGLLLSLDMNFAKCNFDLFVVTEETESYKCCKAERSNQRK